MWPTVVVVVFPRHQSLTDVVHRDELVGVQELVAQPSVERLDQPVVGGLSRPRVVESYAAPLGPLVERLGGELGPVVDGDRPRHAAGDRGLIQGVPDAPSRQAEAGL